MNQKNASSHDETKPHMETPAVEHSDDERSLPPEREDEDRKQGPNDNKPGTGADEEPPVG